MNCITNNNYSYTPSFQAYYKSPFGKRVEQALASGQFSEELAADFEKIFAQKRNLKCKMGAGKYGTVFRIDDYFVFKKYHNYEPKFKPAKVNTKTIYDGLRTYCGKVLARFGNIEIIRNATRDRRDFVQMARSSQEGTRAYAHSLREFCSLPQRAFDNLAQDFQKLNGIFEGHRYCRFDTGNPNNFIKVGNSIKVVDDIDDICPCQNPNDIYAFLRVFIQKGGGARNKKEIFKKCIMACEKYQLPIESAHKYLMKFMNEIFEHAGVKVSFDDFYKIIKNLRETCPNDKQRLASVKEYLETI